MNNLVDKLDEIRLKTRKLCSEYNNLKLRNIFLENEKMLLEEKLSLRKNNIIDLKAERELIINAKSLTELGIDGKEGRHKINELVRGIDRCISHLNQ
tara:strand:- start:104 stop:394 length:291 start_codon:yes stop_codon:yes gene_type:complete